MIPFQVNQPQQNVIKLHHITGLGFKDNEEIKISRDGDDLTFQGRMEYQEAIQGGIQVRKEKDETVKISIQEIEGMDILDESGRSLGKAVAGAVAGWLLVPIPFAWVATGLIGARKRFKSFLVIQAKANEKFTYQIVLGGESQKDIRNKYNKLVELIKSK